MEVIKIKDNSVLINTNKGFNVWMDIYENDGEIICEWNKYIFHINNKLDAKIMQFQYNQENFEKCKSISMDMYLINK